MFSYITLLRLNKLTINMRNAYGPDSVFLPSTAWVYSLPRFLHGRPSIFRVQAPTTVLRMRLESAFAAVYGAWCEEICRNESGMLNILMYTYQDGEIKDVFMQYGRSENTVHWHAIYQTKYSRYVEKTIEISSSISKASNIETFRRR